MRRSYSCLYHEIGTGILQHDPQQKVESFHSYLQHLRDIYAANSILSPGGGLEYIPGTTQPNPRRVTQLGECWRASSWEPGL